MTAGQRWSKERPTEPGWYWFRFPSNSVDPEVFKIHHGEDGLEVVGPFSETPLDEWMEDCDGGEWQGPITPNEEA